MSEFGEHALVEIDWSGTSCNGVKLLDRYGYLYEMSNKAFPFRATTFSGLTDTEGDVMVNYSTQSIFVHHQFIRPAQPVFSDRVAYKNDNTSLFTVIGVEEGGTKLHVLNAEGFDYIEDAEKFTILA